MFFCCCCCHRRWIINSHYPYQCYCVSSALNISSIVILNVTSPKHTISKAHTKKLWPCYITCKFGLEVRRFFGMRRMDGWMDRWMDRWMYHHHHHHLSILLCISFAECIYVNLPVVVFFLSRFEKWKWKSRLVGTTVSLI